MMILYEDLKFFVIETSHSVQLVHCFGIDFF